MAEIYMLGRPEPKPEMLRAMQRARLKYSAAVAVIYLVTLWGGNCVGVFGDPDNAGYEWFVWRDGQLTHSDVGYGDSTVALRDVMNQEIE